jgi:hypothetical protein
LGLNGCRQFSPSRNWIACGAEDQRSDDAQPATGRPLAEWYRTVEPDDEQPAQEGAAVAWPSNIRCQSFSVEYHQFADDTQPYIAISKVDVELQLAKLEKCISSVHQWLLHIELSLNPSKSDAFSSLLVVNAAMLWT